MSAVPKHIAIIMDGNGRWAKGRGLPRIEGHRQGAKTVRMVVEECRKIGVQHLTLFAFSTENWNRPGAEVTGLMKLFEQYLESELEKLLKNDIRLRAMGDLSKLPKGVRGLLERNQERTKDLTGMELILAVSYGGRDEITNAAKQIAEKIKSGELDPSQITEKVFAENLYLSDLPDPDLLIRTSDENRISNFLLWQLAYSEIVVTPVLWPDFSKEEFFKCLEIYSRRSRRFGLTEEQINDNVSKIRTAD